MPAPSAEPHPPRRLPPRPNLEHLKNEAKRRLQALRWLTPQTKLAEVQHQLAREYGFANWRELKASVDRACGPAASPDASAAVGDWIGALNEASRIAMHIRPGEGGFAVTMDTPDHGFFGLAADDVVLGDGRLCFTLLAPLPVGSTQGVYAAQWDAGTERWAGEWTVQGLTVKLDFVRGSYPPAPSFEGLDGFWDGWLKSAKGPIRLAFRFKTDRHGTHAWLDSPDTNLLGRPAVRISRQGQQVTVTMRTVEITGTLSGDGRSMEGQFIKGEKRQPLRLLRRPPGTPAPVPHRPPAVEVPAELLASYAGLYVGDLRTVYVVSLEGKRLFLSFDHSRGSDEVVRPLEGPATPKLELVAASHTTFYWRIMDATLEFERGADGRVSAAVMHQNGRASRAERIG